MTPPPASATAARRAAPAARSKAEPARSNPRSAPLKVVHPRQATSRSRRLMSYAPVGIVVMALMAVVVGQTLLANGQVRLSGVSQQVAAAQNVHRQMELSVSQLEMPTRIVPVAVGELHMVQPTHLIQLPYVPLTTPLATPDVTAVPVAPTPSSSGTGTTAASTPSNTTSSTQNAPQ